MLNINTINLKYNHANWLLTFINIIFVVIGTYLNFFSIIAFIFICLIILFFSNKTSLFVLFAIMPFASIFKFLTYSQSFFTYALMFFVVIQFIRKNYFSLKFILIFLTLIVFLIIQTYVSTDLYRLIKFIVNILFIYLSLTCLDNNEYKSIFPAYISGIIISSIITYLGLINNINAYIEVDTLRLGEDIYYRFSGLYGDPNYYAINLIITLCLLIVLLFSKKIKFIFFIILSIMIILFAILTYSKSAFLMLLLPILLLIITFVKKKKYLFIVILTTILISFVFYKMFGRINELSIIIRRFSQDNTIADMTSGRTNLWIEYMNSIFSRSTSLLIGEGFGASLINNIGSHNTYIDFVYYIGIIGTLIFYFLLRNIFVLNKRKFKRNIINYSVIITILLMYGFLSMIFYFDFSFHVILAIMVYNTNILYPNSEEEKYEYQK